MTVVLRLAKGPAARFISHLDLARALERALRRAGLPLAYSEGFNPRPRISFCSALAVGATSEGELVEVGLRQAVPPDEVRRRLNASLPPGLEVLAARAASPGRPPLARDLRWAAYRLEVQGGATPGGWSQAVRRFLAEPSCVLRRHGGKGEGRLLDARPLVAGVEVTEESGGRAVLRAVLRSTPEATLRPEELVQALARFLPGGGEGATLSSVHRLELLGEGEAGPVPLWEERGGLRAGPRDPDQR